MAAKRTTGFIEEIPENPVIIPQNPVFVPPHLQKEISAVRDKSDAFTNFINGGWATARVAAEYVGRSPTWLLNEARAGRIPCGRLGKRFVFRREDLDAIARNRKGGDA